MTTPIIYSITPMSGHSGGGQVVTIYGANFHVPPVQMAPPERIHGPWLTDPQSPPAFVPGVQVLFSSQVWQPSPGGGPPVLVAGPPVPATNVGVISPGIIQCTTPVHDPSGIPYIDPQPNRAGQAAVPPSDVTVVNLDASGNPVPGESVTLSQAYSFLRPDLTQNGVANTVVEALILDLQRQLLPTVEFNPHTDFDETSGDFLNITFQAALPALALINMKLPQAEGRPRATEEEVTYQTPDGYTVSRLAILRDIVLTVLGVSDNQQELINLAEACEVYWRRTGGINVQANSEDPSAGFVNFPLYRETDTVFTNRIGVSNVMAFTFTIRIVGVPFADMPGVPQDAYAQGATFGGPGTTVDGVLQLGNSVVVQATQ